MATVETLLSYLKRGYIIGSTMPDGVGMMWLAATWMRGAQRYVYTSYTSEDGREVKAQKMVYTERDILKWDTEYWGLLCEGEDGDVYYSSKMCIEQAIKDKSAITVKQEPAFIELQ